MGVNLPGERAAIGVIIVLGAWLRLNTLDGQSLWWDEVMSWRQARLPLVDLIAVTAQDNYPPLYNIILHVTMRLFGESETVLRLPSAIFGTLNIAAIYWVGRQLGGRTAGLIAAALLALSGFHIWYSNEARMYALLGLAATAFAGTTLGLLRSERWAWRAAHVTAGVVLLYSHPYGAITWMAIVIGAGVILIQRRHGSALMRLVALETGALVLFSPWLLVLWGRAADIGQGGFWIPPLTPWGLFQALIQLTNGPFMFAAVAAGARLCFIRTPPPAFARAANADLERPQSLLLLGSWALAPIAAGTVLSLLVAPMLISRYLIGSLPALLILTGIGFSRLTANRSGRLGLLALAVAATVGYAAYTPRPRDDFRAVSAWLKAQGRPGDCYVMIPEAAFGLGYYYRDRLACVAAVRRPADATFETPPSRIVVLRTLDSDISGIERLGTPAGEERFGPTTLYLLEPAERQGS